MSRCEEIGGSRVPPGIHQQVLDESGPGNAQKRRPLRPDRLPPIPMIGVREHGMSSDFSPWRRRWSPSRRGSRITSLRTTPWLWRHRRDWSGAAACGRDSSPNTTRTTCLVSRWPVRVAADSPTLRLTWPTPRLGISSGTNTWWEMSSSSCIWSPGSRRCMVLWRARAAKGDGQSGRPVVRALGELPDYGAILDQLRADGGLAAGAGLGGAALDRGPVGWRWILTMGLTIGLAFHVGFPQNPAFGCGFFVAAVVYLAMVRPWPIRRVLTAVSALLVGAATALHSFTCSTAGCAGRTGPWPRMPGSGICSPG